MNDNFVMAVEGLDNLNALSELPEAIIRKAKMAVSKTVDKARTITSAQMRKEVNFKAGYLTGSGGKLRVSKDLENLKGSISAKFRPTSLARFTTSKSLGKRGVNVQVSPSRTVKMPRAFLVKLPQGSVKTETQFNMGLAIRLKSTEIGKFKKKYWAQLSKGLYLLYGPSVSQVFESVSNERSDEISKFLETEFLRLIKADF